MINENIAQSLADEIVAFIRSKRNKKEEDFLKVKPNKNKKGNITNGAINTRLLSIVRSLSDDKEAITNIEKSKKNKEQSPLVFQKDKYNQLLSLIGEDVVDTKLLDLKNTYQEFLSNNKNDHDPATWLTQWAVKAKDISFATHVGKLTHSSSKSSSILDVTLEKNNRYLTTNRLDNAEIDTASSNATSLPIADVLKLTVNGVSVLDCLKNDDKTLFKSLTDDDVLIDEWCSQLKQAHDSTQKQSYFLSKQIYFPVGNSQYHLLLPLTSSSLVHELHLEHKRYWGESYKIAREQRKNKKYSVTTTRTYPNKAYLHVTGSNHSNASSLNGKRGGRISLLSAMPPRWKSNFPSCVTKLSIFDKTLGFELKNEIDDLKNYLLLIKNKSLSISEPKRNASVIKKLQAISGSFFNYVEMINNVSLPNWTGDSKLLLEQQLLFESWREDEAVKIVKTNKQWQLTLSKSYGRWINKQLSQKNKLSLTPIHEALWANAFLIELREFVAIREVAL